MTTITNNNAPAMPGSPLGGGAALGADMNMFLKMLTTQLQNQDPLKPMDTTAFTQQLVTYSQVEQTMKGNAKLEQIHSMLGGQALSQATALIGHDLAINMPTSVLGTDGARWEYNLAAPSAETTMTIVDQRGRVVRTLEGETKAGIHELTWDGKDQNGTTLPPGLYDLQVSASNAAGHQVQNWVAARGTVQSVHFEGGVPLLDLGGASVRIQDILTVRIPRSA